MIRRLFRRRLTRYLSMGIVASLVAIWFTFVPFKVVSIDVGGFLGIETNISIGTGETHAAGGTTQVIFGGTRDEPSTSATEEMAFMGDGNIAWATTIGQAEVIPTPGTLTNFKVQIKTAPGAGKSYTFTVRVNGVASDLSQAIADTNTESSLDESEVSVSAGDYVDIACTPSGTPTAAGAVYWTCEFIPTTSGETILLSNSGNATLTASRYMPLIGGKLPDSTEFDAQTLFPTAGTLKNFYVQLSAAPGTGKSRTFTVRVNGVASDITVTISNSDTTGSDTSHTASISAGDKVSIINEVSGTPSSSRSYFGIVFDPTTEGEFITCATSDDSTPASGTEYQHLTCGDSTLTATENEQYNLARACTAKKIYVALHQNISGTIILTLRQNGGDTSLTVTISGSNASGNASYDVSISNDDLLDTGITVSGLAATCKTQIAYLFYIAPTGGCTEDITNSPSSWSVNSGSPVAANSNYATGLTFFTVTNNSGGAVDISISGTDMTGGGYTWTLSDTATPGDMTYGLYAGLSGGSYNIIVKKNSPFNNLVAGLADSGTQDWGLKIYTPTVYSDGNAKSGVVTITATCS